MLYCLFMLSRNYKLTDSDKLLSSRNLCLKLNINEFKTVTKIIYRLEYGEEPNYDKIRFEFMKILLGMNKLPSCINLDWNVIRPS